MAVIAFIGCFILFMMLADTRNRLKRAEATLAEAAKRIGALQRHTGLTMPSSTGAPMQVRPAAPLPVEPVPEPELVVVRAAALAITPDPSDHVVSELIEPPATEEPEAAAEPEAAPPEAIEPPVQEPAALAEEHEAEPVIVEAVEAPPAAPPAPPEPPLSMASRFEDLFGKKLPIWAGGITLAIAGVLIVKYAIDQGIFGRIFTHGVQIGTGLLFGTGLIAGAEFAWRNEDKVRDVRVPQALSGAGIATLYASVLVAANAYELISALTAFIALAVITASALGLSLRFGAPSALLGLAGGLAAPAMVGSLAPNVPLLAVYLGLTIAGLTGVSRMRRWPWLALAALVGGAGWSLWMILASNALDAMASISIGGFVLLLAIALPMLALNGPRAAFLRSISAIIGAAQLALLVAYGGFIPLHWGLFALLAAAGQWLAWRDSNFAIVPTIGLALSGLLLALWPAPSGYWFTVIGLSLAAIHAAPLLARLWQMPPGLQRTLELCGLALAAPVLTKWHFWQGNDDTLALVAFGAAAVTATAIAMGWKREDRFDDHRFALLTATTGTLLALATVLVLPDWQAPLGIAVIAAALLFFGKAARDLRIESIAATFALLTLPALLLTMTGPQEIVQLVLGASLPLDPRALLRGGGLVLLFALFAWQAVGRELRFLSLALAGALTYGTLAQAVAGWSLPLMMGAVALAIFGIAQYRASTNVERLAAGFAALTLPLLMVTGIHVGAEWGRLLASDAASGSVALPRWGGLALLAVLFASRSQSGSVWRPASIIAALLAYGTIAQFVTGTWLPLVPAIGGAAVLLATTRFARERLHFAAGTFAALSLAWATAPLMLWGYFAMQSLGGVPMIVDPGDFAANKAFKQLLAPALLFGAALWQIRAALGERVSRAALGLCAVVAGIALHWLYRLGFAAAFGADFIETGLAQRLVWEGLLIGGGWLALLRQRERLAFGLLGAGTAHALWYTLMLHNPLWDAQAVGSIPLANLLVPMFAAVPLGIALLCRMWPDRPAIVGRIVQPFHMLLVCGFAWATLRQAYHGTLLVTPGVFPTENILRSILFLALAIGFLLWGIRAKRHDWRIASLVLMLGAVGKVFLFDASGLEGLLRIGSFVALGFSLIGIGWLYSRQLAASPGSAAN